MNFRVDAPDLPGPPGICWRAARTTERCTFDAGHDGPCSWARCPKRCDIATPPEAVDGKPGRFVCVGCGTEFG